MNQMYTKKENIANKDDLFRLMQDKSAWVRRETLRIHKIAPGIRLASCLSCVEIFAVLYYSGIMRYKPGETLWDGRDRFIISKPHGAVSLYPILADKGYFDMAELAKVGKKGAILNDIPDGSIPGFETINGSLGHGLGLACGVALGLKRRNRKELVYVLSGDGELFEGSVWEAIMFASHHRLDNLILIIDNNKICMLDYCKNILDLGSLEEKFRIFGWHTHTVDGHDVKDLHHGLSMLIGNRDNEPKVLIANTVKGKGVPRLEGDSLCHIKALKGEEIDKLLMETEC
jgi:transketolase